MLFSVPFPNRNVKFGLESRAQPHGTNFSFINRQKQVSSPYSDISEPGAQQGRGELKRYKTQDFVQRFALSLADATSSINVNICQY